MSTKTEPRLSLTRALMIIRNPEAGYGREQVRAAVLLVLSSLGASAEDQMQAASLL